MKKSIHDTKLESLDIHLDNKYQNNNIKTTNINILLNRVRLDKKRMLKKRIFFSFFLVSTVSALAVYFII